MNTARGPTVTLEVTVSTSEQPGVVPHGTHVGLCAHLPHSGGGGGVVLEVTDDADRKHLVMLCRGCFVRYVDEGDVITLVAREIVAGHEGLDITVEMEVPS